MINIFKFKKKRSRLADQIRETLPEGMLLPDPLEKLFSWIENNGFTWENNGKVGGALAPLGSPKFASCPYIEFSAEGAENLKYWFGQNNDELRQRLYVFCKTGADGSQGAFWLDDDNNQKIVHLGSGSGSTMTCVLTDNGIDFLRLLAIGYDEICWGKFNTPPSDDMHANIPFQNWVRTEFSVLIPATGNEIVEETANMGDEKSTDPFLHWANNMTAH